MRRAYGFACLLLLAAELPLAAQIGYPGQYPPGQYPPGGYPGGGPGIGLPRRGKKTTTSEKNTPAPSREIEGMLRRLDEKLIVVQTPDARIISIHRGDKTKFLKDDEAIKPATLKPGDHLRVEVTEDDSGFFYAVNVNLEKPGTAAERANASQPVEVIMPSSKTSDDPDRPVLRRAGPAANDSKASDDPDRPVLRRNDPPKNEPPAPPPAPEAAKQPVKSAPPAPEQPSDTVPPLDAILNAPAPPPAGRDADDPGPPKLQRGRPPARRTTPDPPEPPAQPKQVATARPPAPAVTVPTPAPVSAEPPAESQDNSHHDQFIEKAREKAAEFTETLPSYICQEFMARFVNTSHTVNWQPQDVVSMEVVYENGKESYRNLAVNNKPSKKEMKDLGGSWSTGEFGTMLLDLFHPGTQADFRYRRESTAGGKAALVYDYTVDQPHSHWNIVAAAQSYNPPYRGSVWIDKRTYRVLRIEMLAYRFPEEFPFDKVESVSEYDYVRFGSERQYLMPVHAETLMCQRGTSVCSMNKIDFRNYHKYSGESSITFGEEKKQ
jgi:hypothetical protein